MSAKREYFGGPNWLTSNKVSRLSATSWPELVQNFFNVPHVLKVRREVFHAWPEDERKKFKAGQYVCACSFKTDTAVRNDANAKEVVLAILDLDDPELARPFVESPATISDALYPLNFCAYHTASSTPEKPHLRVAVEVEPAPVEDHKLYVSQLFRLLGLPSSAFSGKRESLVLSQPMARPVMFEGEEPNAVIASRTNGVALTRLDIPNDILEETHRTYAYQGEHGGELDSLPIRDLKVEDIREPLFKIDPDVSYEAWLGVLAGLRHQFRDEEDAEEAFQLALEWSSGGEKFKGDEEVYAKWRSLKPDFGGRRPVTVKSLFRKAIESGWDNSRFAAKFEGNVMEWLEQCDDAAVLKTEGHRRIADMPFKNDMVEESLMRALKARIKRLGGGEMSLHTIQKAVGKARFAKKNEEDNGDLPNWLRPYCFIRSIDRFHNMVSGVPLTPEAFNRAFGKELMPSNPEEEAAKAGVPSIQPQNFALNVKQIPQVDGIIYDPRQGSATEPFFTDPTDGRRYVNEYRWSTVPAEIIDGAVVEKARKILLKHLEVLFPGAENEEVRLTLLDWLAFQVQNPGVKIRWAPVIQGAQGCGKTFIARILGAALGHANIKIANPSTIKQGWNDWATGAQTVVIEEIWVQGSGRMEIMNSLKDIMADDRIALNKRNAHATTVPHVTNFIAFTNHHNALSLEASDRRWYVLKCAIQTKEQVNELTGRMIGGMGYFDRLGLLVNKFGGAIRHILLNYEIRGSFKANGTAPDTIWRRNMIMLTENPMIRRIKDLMEDRHPMVQDDVIYYPALERLLATEIKGNGSPQRFLADLGFHPFNNGQRFQLNGTGEKGPVWINPRHYDESFGSPFSILKERYDEIPDETI